jgi:hypothetical protein
MFLTLTKEGNVPLHCSAHVSLGACPQAPECYKPALWMIHLPPIHHNKLLTSNGDCQNLLKALLESCSFLIYSALRGNCQGS